MSHEVVKFSVPVSLSWNEHSAGSAMTVTGDAASAASSAGIGEVRDALEDREVGHAASRKPAIMIGLRPILSDSQPNRMKHGVPISKRDRDHDLRRRLPGP